MEANGSNTVLREYLHYPGIDVPHSVRIGSTTYFYAMEQPGHVVGLAYGTGTVAQRYRYSAWGVAEQDSGSVTQPLRFMAREVDSSTGLYYVRNRWYSTEGARFISEDPIGLVGGINTSSYVANPLGSRDPMGLGPRRRPLISLLMEARWLYSCSRGCWPALPNECTRDPSGGCILHPVPEVLWDRARLRIESIRESSPECTEAKNSLRAAWAQGRESMSIRFWYGHDYVRDLDGRPVRWPDGRYKVDIGFNNGPWWVAFNARAFFLNPSLPVHEGFHHWLAEAGDPWGDVREAHPRIEALASSCPATYSIPANLLPREGP